MPSDLQDLIGLCDNQDGSQLEVINISEDVLDIYPAAGDTLQSPITYDVPSDPLPTLAGELEVEAQNAVVADSSAPAGADLLAIGGTITAANNPPATAEVYVGVDHAATKKTFFAASWTSYVMGIDSHANPHDYYRSVADCVNNAVNYWQALQAQPPQPVGRLLYGALEVIVACKDVQDKVKQYLESRNEHEDVHQETLLAGDHSDESDWSSQYEQYEDIQHDLTDIR